MWRATHYLPALFAAFTLLTAQPSHGQSTDKIDPNGIWTWKFETSNGNSFLQTLRLKLDGEKLFGKLGGRGGQEIAIQEPKLQGDEISFQISRERDGKKFISKYKGRINGNVIKGKVESNWGGEVRVRDWDAKRQIAKR